MNLNHQTMNALTARLKRSRLVKDSFWAVFGNGMGYGLLLIAGILIARLLGRDLYGEYGLVKTTMFHAATLATFGLGFTSTKFVAEYRKRDTSHLRGIISSSSFITLLSSSIFCAILIVFAQPLADYLEHPQLSKSLRMLGVIVVVNALLTNQKAVLAGLGEFRSQSIYTIISGVVMLALCVPLTYYFGLWGSLCALFISQLTNVVLNQIRIYSVQKSFPNGNTFSYVRQLLTFSVPIALQEVSYTISMWGGSLLLVKYASIGEMGIYSATSQWNAIIMFIPGLLKNVVLTHLSHATDNQASHRRTIRRMLIVNLTCTLIPFIFVASLSNWISTFYGPTFVGMASVLNVFILSTIFHCLATVYQSELLAQSHTWALFTIRAIRDIVMIIVLYFLLTNSFVALRGSMCYAVVMLGTSAIYFIMLWAFYRRKISQN